MRMETYTIDATGKKLGRIATEAAMVLRGKNKPDFSPNRLPNVRVEIINAAKVDLSEAKREEEYTRYTGYPGGLINETRGHLMSRKGIAPVFMHAVRGMLPANKLRSQALKQLVITE